MKYAVAGIVITAATLITGAAVAEGGTLPGCEVYGDYWYVPGSDICLKIGGKVGVVYSGNYGLQGAGQDIEFGIGGFGGFSAGVLLPLDSSPFLVDLGGVVEYMHFQPVRLVNIPPGVGALAFGGDSFFDVVNVYPRVGVEAPVVDGIGWFAGVGAGASYQRFSATNGGAVVLSGTGIATVLSFDAGLRVALTQSLDFGVRGFANWHGGIPLTAGGTTFQTSGAWATGIGLSLTGTLP